MRVWAKSVSTDKHTHTGRKLLAESYICKFIRSVSFEVHSAVN
jgi:hypothetical protein